MSIYVSHLALIDACVPGRDVSDDEDPIFFVVVGNLVFPDQLEPVVLGEHLVAVSQDVPVPASNPGQLKKKKNPMKLKLNQKKWNGFEASTTPVQSKSLLINCLR